MKTGVRELPDPVRDVVQKVLSQFPRYRWDLREIAVNGLSDLVRRPDDIWHLHYLGVEYASHPSVIDVQVNAGLFRSSSVTASLVVWLDLEMDSRKVVENQMSVHPAVSVGSDLWERGWEVDIWTPPRVVQRDPWGNVVKLDETPPPGHVLASATAFSANLLFFDSDTRTLINRGSPERFVNGLSRST